MLRAHSVVRPDLSEEEEDPRLLLNGSLASDGDFSETESYGSPLPQPRTGTHRHRYDDDSGEHGSVFAPAVLPAGHRKSLKSLPKMRRLKESVWDFVSVITYLYCMYVFVVVFVTTISFSINFLSQLIFTCATARNFSSAVYPVVVIALIIFGLYAVTAFPILIHDVFALVADSVPRRAQYRKFADRLLFTTLPQRVLSRWYSPEASLLLPAREVDTRRHAVVRTIIIVPSVIAAIPVAVVAGDVSLFPAWFLCISFLVCLGLAVLFIITGYFKALSEHCEYYRWIRVQWAEAPYKLPGGGSAGEPERSGDASWGRALVIRTGLVLAALATPLSFHNAVWKFQVKGHRMEVAEQEALEEEVAINLGFVPPRKQPGCFRSCFRATKRVLWSSTWLLLPLSVFVIVTMFCLISVRAGVSALLFFLLSFPAVGIAFKHIWKGKASIWPLAVYVVLLGLTLLGFGFLLGSLSTQTQAAHISPDSPALLNLLPPPLPLDSSSTTSSSPSSPSSSSSSFSSSPSSPSSSSSRLAARQPPPSPPPPSHPSSLANGRQTTVAAEKQPPMQYQLCNAQWGDLDIVDFGLLSWLAYFEINSTDYWRYADHWFNGSDWQLRHFQQEPVHFFDFYSPSRNLSVVSVRGTASIVDGLEDLDLWSEALQLELVSMVFPFVFTWPDSSTAVLVQVMSYLERMFVPTDDDFSYFSSVLAYVRLIKSQRKVMMTGHSLGGSVAQVVGAKEGLPAITYNAPGIVYSRRKFGVEFDAIQQWTATIRTTSDLISAIDQPGGTVQDVRCDTEMAFPDCHFLGHLLCPLLRGGCGHHTLDQPSPIVYCHKMARKRKEAEVREREATQEEEEEVKRAKKKQKKKHKKKKKEKKVKKNKEVGAPCLPDDPNLLNIILDYALYAQADQQLDHPLRAVNRATRQAWLAHPISLPFRLRLSLGASSPAARLPLAQRLRLVAMFECALSNFGHAAKSELKRQRKEKARGRNLGLLLERVDRWVDARKKKMKKTKGARSKKEIEEEITELRAEARKLIGRATDVEIISRHQYGDNVYCWSQYQISFQIEGEEFQVTHGETQSTFCPYEDEITIPEVERLAELREKWHTPLDADTLHCLFGFLLPYDDIAQAYNFHMVILSSQDEDIDE